MATRSGELPPRQAAFVDCYCVRWDATEAAIQAGYSERTAAAQGCRLLSNVKVAAAIAFRRLELAQKLSADQARVLEELRRIAYGDQRALMSWDGGGVRVRPSSELTDEEAAAVAEVAPTKRGVRIRSHDKLRALQLLAQYTGLVQDGGPQVSVDNRTVTIVYEDRRQSAGAGD